MPLALGVSASQQSLVPTPPRRLAEAAPAVRALTCAFASGNSPFCRSAAALKIVPSARAAPSSGESGRWGGEVHSHVGRCAAAATANSPSKSARAARGRHALTAPVWPSQVVVRGRGGHRAQSASHPASPAPPPNPPPAAEAPRKLRLCATRTRGAQRRSSSLALRMGGRCGANDGVMRRRRRRRLPARRALEDGARSTVRAQGSDVRGAGRGGVMGDVRQQSWCVSGARR
jgi:hypothetical protein